MADALYRIRHIVTGEEGCTDLVHRHSRNDIYSIEPGDGTHYEVMVAGDFAIAVVGFIFDDRLQGVMVTEDACKVNVIGKPTAYTESVCAYFCRLALGMRPQDEPMGWRLRRDCAQQRRENGVAPAGE